MISWGLSCLEFIELLAHVYSCLSSDLQSLRPLFLQMIFLPLPLFPLLLGFQYTYVGMSDGIPHVPQALLIFLHSFFYTLLRLNNFFIYKFIYLFMAALGLRCTRAFPSGGEWGLLFAAVCRLLIAVASLVAKHGL